MLRPVIRNLRLPPRQVSIVGAQSLVQPKADNGSLPPRGTTTALIQQVLTQALEEARLCLQDIDGWISVPSLGEHHFMEAHFHATQLDLFSTRPHLRCKTIDTGGAGPISALLEGTRMIQVEGLECVAIVAADTVGSMPAQAFLEKAEGSFREVVQNVDSPVIPNGYDKLSEYQMAAFGVTRDQLRMTVCLESFHAARHPKSLYRRKALSQQADNGGSVPPPPLPATLNQVREAPDVTPNISLLECALRADGAACVLLCSNRFLARQGLYQEGLPTVTGGGEASGPLWPAHPVTEDHFSCAQATDLAYATAGNLSASDIDFFGLYDCFPICLVRALEAAGLCGKGEGGSYVEEQYQRMVQALRQDKGEQSTRYTDALLADPSFFPVNTHGGLLCFGAPWEVPAMYNVVEAVQQLRGHALGRQIPNCRRALVYGNGGVMSASAVAILSRSL